MSWKRTGTTLTTVALLLLATVAGVGLVAADDLPSSSDGDISNGEELKSAQDDDDQLYDINYTFVLRNHQPGYTDGYAEHYAVGLTENITLHRIKIYSEAIGYSNCEPGNTGAFGIDRGNDDPGTTTDVSLLNSYKSYNSQPNYIDIKYYREDKLAGGPIGFNTVDQVVASQRGCYDNPSEPGWYRINGTITGSSNGDTTTDYKVRDLSQWIYICDCDSRAEAESKLGPPPGQSGTDGGDGGSATATPTATPASGGNGGGATPTPTPTATPASGGTDGGATPTPTPTATVTATPASGGNGGGGAPPTATPSDGGGRATPTATATASNDGGAGGAGGGSTATATATAARGGGPNGAGNPSAPATPTVGAGPGFGALAALAGLLAAALLALRRD